MKVAANLQGFSFFFPHSPLWSDFLPENKRPYRQSQSQNIFHKGVQVDTRTDIVMVHIYCVSNFYWDKRGDQTVDHPLALPLLIKNVKKLPEIFFSTQCALLAPTQ